MTVRTKIRIDSESMLDPWLEVVVYTRSIPDPPQLQRVEIIVNHVERTAFASSRGSTRHSGGRQP